MTDSEEIAKLKAKVKELKKQLAENKQALAENKEADEKRHKELKEQLENHHKDNLLWSKVSALGTPMAITFIFSLIAYFLRKGKKDDKGEDEATKNKLW